MNQLDNGGLGSEFLRTGGVGITSYDKNYEVEGLGREGVDYSTALLACCSDSKENFRHCTDGVKAM